MSNVLRECEPSVELKLFIKYYRVLRAENECPFIGDFELIAVYVIEKDQNLYRCSLHELEVKNVRRFREFRLIED